MKKHRELHIIRKISMVFIIFVVLFQFMMPIRSEAIDIKDDLLDAAEDVLKYMAQIVAGGGDLVMGAFNKFFLGTDGFSTAMIDSTAIGKNGSWFDNDGLDDDYASKEGNFGTGDVYIGEEEVTTGTNATTGEEEKTKKIVIYVKKDSLENSIVAGSENWEVPNLLYCPENIFGNNIAMLDVNFLNPNVYQQVQDSESGGKAKESIAGRLKTTIVSWYRSFRNLAIVALLSILVYLGIRILISSTAEDKAKYKQTIRDWAIALCLVFVMHFIMSAVIFIVNQVNTLFQNVNNNIYVNYGGEIFRTNFTGAIRFLGQSTTTGNAWVYTIIYYVIIGYTFVFTLQYLKRVLYIAFYTMISPLVAITYPIDKLGDGKSQAFNHWLKEYIMTMVLQPIHLIVYTMIVSSSLSLSIENPIFALVAIGFLTQAEKFIRSLFGVNSQADGGFGSFATGALSMQALNSLRKERFAGKKEKAKLDKGGTQDKEDTKVRQANNKPFSSWMDGNSPQNEEDEQEQLNAGPQQATNDDDTNPSGPNGGNIPQGDPGILGGGSSTQMPINATPVGFQEPDKEQMADIDDPNSEYWKNFDQENGIDKQQYMQDLRNNYDEYSGYDDPYGLWLSRARNEALDRNRQQASGQTTSRQPTTRPQQASAPQQVPKRKIKGPKANKSNNADLTPEQKYRRMRGIRLEQWADRNIKPGKVIKGIAKAGFAGARFVAKNGLRAVGAATLGTVGLASGIASGKGVVESLTRAGVGIGAGIKAGTSISNLAEGMVRKPIGLVSKGVQRGNEWSKEYQANRLKDMQRAGRDEEAKEYEHSITLGRRAPMETRAKNREKYGKLVDQYALKKGKRMNNKERKDMMERIYDYDVNYGVTDKDKIFKGLDLEEKYKDKYKDQTHDKVAGVMQLTNSYGEKYINDPKSNQEFRTAMDKRGITGQKQEDLVELFHAAYDEEYQPKEKTSQGKQEKKDKQQNPKITTNSNGEQQTESEIILGGSNYNPSQDTTRNTRKKGNKGSGKNGSK